MVRRVKVLVRCPDRMVFPVHAVSGQPMRCSYYDAYCFTDPRPDVKYLSYAEWCASRQRQWGKKWPS